jgi:2-methylcitrate dehydratase PrpD
VYHGGRAVAQYAAYANALFGHSCEFDDSHFWTGHPGVCTVPVALAVAERQGSSGRDVLTAVVAGYQAMVQACGPIHYSTLTSGWHGTKVGGVFGAAATAGKLLGLNEAQLAQALAIAGSDASGTMEYDQSGGEVKRLHPAMAARSGVEAALLAGTGMTGPLTIFEGNRGIYRLFGDGRPADVGRFFDGRFHIMDTFFKLYPAVGTVHAALDALREVMERNTFETAEVVEIDVGLAPYAIVHGASIVRPADAVSAQFSVAFSLALRLVRHANELDSYTDPRSWSDPDVLAIADKVRAHGVSFEPGACELGATVDVVLRDGRRLAAKRQAPRGHPDNPATTRDLEEKFFSLTKGVLPPGVPEQVLRTVNRLEEQPDVGGLMALVGAPVGAR